MSYVQEKWSPAKEKQLIESPDYKTSCLSTLKSFLSFSSGGSGSSNSSSEDGSDMDGTSDMRHAYSFSSNDDDVQPIRIFSQFDSTQRLKRLRTLMKLNNLTAYIIPSEDEHQSEYTSVKDQRRAYVSGFTGSAGVAIVTLHSAALSTDSRYFLQASEQLDGNWTLLKQGVKGYPSWMDWGIDECVYQMDQMGETGDIGVDPRLITWSMGNDLIRKTHENNIRLVNDLDKNLIDAIRGKLKDTGNHEVSIYPYKYSGMDTSDKIVRVRKMMQQEGCFAYVSNMLDSIAYLLNLRGNDIIFNPVFFCYVIIYMDEVVLYIDKKKLTAEVQTYLSDLRIDVRVYDQIWNDLPAITNKSSEEKESNKICLELNSSYSIYINIPSTYEIVFRSILTELKGVKNDIEMENLRESQTIDSLAIVRFLSWFDANHPKRRLNELDVVDKLYEFRNKSLKFKGLSFETIAASGANAAIVHYEPTSDNFGEIETDNVLLLDSGGQYLEGTTDITRTTYVYRDKKPSDELRRSYTLVLKGHLNIAMLRFKFGTSSYYIDSLGRAPLRQYGLDYGHGTGHGIDNYICVHAGPCGLSPSRTSYNYKPLEAGNFISDEPGYYKAGEYGIRIESDVLVVNGDDGRLQFEYLTMVPFCRDLIDLAYLSSEQVKWVDEYHRTVYETLVPHLEAVDDVLAIEWLRRATEPLR